VDDVPIIGKSYTLSQARDAILIQ